MPWRPYKVRAKRAGRENRKQVTDSTFHSCPGPHRAWEGPARSYGILRVCLNKTRNVGIGVLFMGRLDVERTRFGVSLTRVPILTWHLPAV